MPSDSTIGSSKKAAKNKAILDAMESALKASNYACHDCGRSYLTAGVRTKCSIRKFETLEIDVLCEDCRAARMVKQRDMKPWISDPVNVHDADPNCPEESPF
jgi:hypothetical protein